MNETTNRRSVIVGLFVLIGLVFLVAGILAIGNLRGTFTKKIKVTALFDDVGGLQTGNNVWFSGVKIGTVSGMQFYKEFQVRVTVNIDLKAQEYIRKDSKIKIGSDGLIGNKILIIYGGTSRIAEVQDGDTLTVEKTFTQEDMVNALQENNVNLLSVTKDLKTISKSLVNGEGTLGKLINDNVIYNDIAATTSSLKDASRYSSQLINSLAQYSANLNKKGTLANNLVTDTVVFQAIRASSLRLEQIADTATVFMSSLKVAVKNPNTAVGVLLNDKESGALVKTIIQNMESSTKKLDEDLEAAQHSFLLRGYFRKKEKAERKAAEKQLP
jgi:phospholipid/cholesterol/gamma-HCH transport system substrate-binding protein